MFRLRVRAVGSCFEPNDASRIPEMLREACETLAVLVRTGRGSAGLWPGEGLESKIHLPGVFGRMSEGRHDMRYSVMYEFLGD